jgi:autotransporter family porin
MNKSYKIIWNESLQDWVVAGEFAAGKKKTKTSIIVAGNNNGVRGGGKRRNLPICSKG